jgi:hypothetical protein
MSIFKDNMSLEDVTDKILLEYLIRCHHIISKDCPEIKDMEPANAGNYLMHLRKTGRIDIKLNCIDNRIRCKIIDKK